MKDESFSASADTAAGDGEGASGTPVQSVFVCEYLSAGGGEDAGLDPALRDEGRAMRDAIVGDLLAAGLRVGMACHGGERGVAGSPDRPNAIRLRAAPGQALRDFIAEQARRHARTWLVAPETGGVLAALHAAVVGAAGAQAWIGCDAEAIATAGSKRATLQRLAAHGLATPLAFAPAREAGVTHWVVKPDDGAGALATQRHASQAAALADLRAREAAGETATLEPWIDGEAWSLSLLCDRRGSVELLSVNRQDVRIDADGEVAFRGVVLDHLPRHDARRAALRGLAERIGRAVPGLRGFVGIDLVWHAERGPVVIEINPRPTSAYVGLSATLGRNLGREILDAAG